MLSIIAKLITLKARLSASNLYYAEGKGLPLSRFLAKLVKFQSLFRRYSVQDNKYTQVFSVDPVGTEIMIIALWCPEAKVQNLITLFFQRQ